MNYHKNMDNDYSTLLDKAYKLHVSGNYAEAKLIYEKLIEINPNNPDVINLLAQLYVAIKAFDKAILLFKKAYEITKIDDIKVNLAKVYVYKNDYNTAIDELTSINKKNSTILNLIAFIYMKKSDYLNAAKYYEELTSVDDKNLNILYNLSLCYLYLNKLNEAIDYAQKAYDLNSNDLDLLLHLAHLFEKVDNKEKALYFLIKASEISENPDIFYRMGVLYKNLEIYNDAVTYFQKVLNIEPNNKEALLNIAQIYRNIDKNEALNIYIEAHNKFPDDTNILFCIYSVYVDMLDFDNALAIALDLIQIDTKNSMYYSMVADAYLELFDYNNAIKYYKMSLEYNPNDDGAKCSLAYAYSCHRNDDKALEILNKLKKTPAVIQDLTIIHLRKKNFKEVEEYYYNWHTKSHTVKDAAEKASKYFYKLKVGEKYGISEQIFSKFRSELPANILNKINIYKKKLWNKEDISGKNILVYSAHGAGDLIMFSRYLNILSQKAKHITLTAPDSLVDLLKYNFKNVDVINRECDIDESCYDFSTPEMGLIYNLNMDFNNIPFPEKYIDISEELIKEKAKLDIFNNDKIKVGLFWQGNPTTLRNRSAKLKYFSPLFLIDRCKYYSFQLTNIDFESNDIKEKSQIIDLSPYIQNYSDTAALLKNIDILITIDTSIAHLAGAMGIRTYLMLPYDSEWRWFYNEKSTEWYNSIKIFKQNIPNDWDSVIDRIKIEIENNI